MTSVWGRGRLLWKRPSDVSFVAPFVAPLDSSPPLKLGDKLYDQLARPSRTKLPVANASATTISILKYSEDDLQRIFKAVMEAWAPAPALIVSELPLEKLKIRFANVYRKKSHMDCYSFCQQCEDYFATARATGLTRILFATSFLWDQISFR